MRHEDQERQDRLEHLYEIDGRHDPAHPAHSTYTGLWAKYTTTTTTENDGSSVAGLDDRSSSGAGDDQSVPEGTAEPSEL